MCIDFVQQFSIALKFTICPFAINSNGLEFDKFIKYKCNIINNCFLFGISLILIVMNLQ